MDMLEATRSRLGGPRVLPWRVLAARLTVGGVLLVAGALKVRDPLGSVLAVRAYEVLPGPLETLVGRGLPWLEIALGLLLILGLGTRAMAWASAGLLAVFVVGIAQAWARGLSIDCGCFGGGGAVDPAGKAWRYISEILRDTALIGLALLVVRHPRSRLSLDHHLTRGDT